MPTIRIPLTTFSVQQARPGHKFGSPNRIPMRNGSGNDMQLIARVPIDRVPENAIVQSAILHFWTARPSTGSTAVRVYSNTKAWKSGVTWNSKPSVGPILVTTTKNAPADNTLYTFDLTSWATGRTKNGLTLDTSGATLFRLRGSSAEVNKPYLEVTYVVIPDVPSDLAPDGGAVSSASPILSYQGDEDLTAQQVQYSSDGTTPGVTYDSGWISASATRFDPASDTVAPTPPVLAVGQTTYWRVRTDGPSGQSGWSGWAQYSYQPLTAPVITNPPATTDDGSPTLQWTTSSQTSWRADFYSGATLLDREPWDEDSTTRSWTPGKSVRVPGGSGRFVLFVRDGVTPRVAAEGAPTWSRVEREFTTVLDGDGEAVDTLAYSFNDPAPVITGTRVLGIPDYVSLYRDDVQVPIWDPVSGTPYMWAPAANFFSGQAFTLPDYTAPPRGTYTWKVRVKVGGITSAGGLSVTAEVRTSGVWLVNPRTGERVDVQGLGDVPVVAQETTEGSVLHTPVHGDLIVEPVRRRLMRTTRAGSIEGVVLDQHEGYLEDWAEQDSSLRYRLVFGKVNWSVILGDYSPQDMFYPDAHGPDRVAVSLNWWQRLRDY